LTVIAAPGLLLLFPLDCACGGGARRGGGGEEAIGSSEVVSSGKVSLLESSATRRRGRCRQGGLGFLPSRRVPHRGMVALSKRSSRFIVLSVISACAAKVVNLNMKVSKYSRSPMRRFLQGTSLRLLVRVIVGVARAWNIDSRYSSSNSRYGSELAHSCPVLVML